MDGKLQHVGAYWVITNGIYNGSNYTVFVKKPKQSSAAAIKAVEPMYAECLATIQYILYKSALNALGDDTRFDKIHGDVLTLGCPVLTDIHLNMDIKDHETIVPGDLVYFSNAEFYATLHPGGAWRGENCVYGGFYDSVCHYHGLGLINQTEAMLRRAMLYHLEYDSIPPKVMETVTPPTFVDAETIITDATNIFRKAERLTIDTNGNGIFDGRPEDNFDDANHNGVWDVNDERELKFDQSQHCRPLTGDSAP